MLASTPPLLPRQNQGNSREGQKGLDGDLGNAAKTVLIVMALIEPPVVIVPSCTHQVYITNSIELTMYSIELILSSRTLN